MCGHGSKFRILLINFNIHTEGTYNIHHLLSRFLAMFVQYMLADWYRPGNCLDYPKGGSGAIVEALVRGIQKWGKVHNTQSAVHVNTHVSEILIEGSGKDARAAGVRLQDGTTIMAKQAIVCNADPFVIS